MDTNDLFWHAELAFDGYAVIALSPRTVPVTRTTILVTPNRELAYRIAELHNSILRLREELVPLNRQLTEVVIAALGPAATAPVLPLSTPLNYAD